MEPYRFEIQMQEIVEVFYHYSVRDCFRFLEPYRFEIQMQEIVEVFYHYSVPLSDEHLLSCLE